MRKRSVNRLQPNVLSTARPLYRRIGIMRKTPPKNCLLLRCSDTPMFRIRTVPPSCAHWTDWKRPFSYYHTLLKAGSELKPNWPSGHGKEQKKKNDFVHRSQTAKKIESKKKKVLFGSNFFFLSILELFFSRTRRQSLPLGRFRRGRATQKVDQAKTAARTRP